MRKVFCLHCLMFWRVKTKKNDILYNWIESKGYYCNYLNKDYSNSNYHRKNKDSISEEVLITNYPME